jgi:hypothetical protein
LPKVYTYQSNLFLVKTRCRDGSCCASIVPRLKFLHDIIAEEEREINSRKGGGDVRDKVNQSRKKIKITEVNSEK